MSTETTILVGVSIYLLAMIVIGVAVARRAGTQDDFIVAGGKLPLWICVPTIIATWFGGGIMLGAAGTGYQGGFLASISSPFGSSLTMILIGFFFVRTLRRMKLLTVGDFFESRFGRLAAVIASAALLLAIIGWIGGLMVAFGYIFQTMTSVPMEIGILAGGVIVIGYTAIGGMWAVALTDVVQIVIITIGLLVLLVVVLIDVGGWSVIAPQLPEHTFRLIPLEHSLEIWLNYLRLWIIFGIADLASQSLMQRVFAADSERTAQNAFYLAGAGHLLLGLIPVFLGIIAGVTMPGLDDPETVIPRLAIEHLHPVAIAIFVGALLAAIMSSADSTLLAAASVFSNNILPLFKPQASDRLRLLVTRVAIPIFGIIAIYVALEVKAVYDLIMDANSVMLVCVVVPFIVGVWWRRANRTGALASMAMGFITWFLAILFAPELPGDLLGLMTGLLTMLIVTPLTQKTDPPTRLLNIDGEEVEMKDRLGTLPLFRRTG